MSLDLLYRGKLVMKYNFIIKHKCLFHQQMQSFHVGIIDFPILIFSWHKNKNILFVDYMYSMSYNMKHNIYKAHL